jgi:hypothetical protein
VVNQTLDIIGNLVTIVGSGAGLVAYVRLNRKKTDKSKSDIKS